MLKNIKYFICINIVLITPISYADITKAPKNNIETKLQPYIKEINKIENEQKKLNKKLENIKKTLFNMRINLAYSPVTFDKIIIEFQEGRCLYLLGEYSKSYDTLIEVISFSIALKLEELFKENNINETPVSGYAYFYIEKIYEKMGNLAIKDSVKKEKYEKAYQISRMILKRFEKLPMEIKEQINNDLKKINEKLKRFNIDPTKIPFDNKTISKFLPIESTIFLTQEEFIKHKKGNE